jgi:hypothetical protein
MKVLEAIIGAQAIAQGGTVVHADDGHHVASTGSAAPASAALGQRQAGSGKQANSGEQQGQAGQASLLVKLLAGNQFLVNHGATSPKAFYGWKAAELR